jgi:hypothetical protein
MLAQTFDALITQWADASAAARQTVRKRQSSNRHRPLSNTVVFDPAKHVLGKLCPRRHDYQGTGQSALRQANRHCVLCDREKARGRERAKRQPRAAMT